MGDRVLVELVDTRGVSVRVQESSDGRAEEECVWVLVGGGQAGAHLNEEQALIVAEGLQEFARRVLRAARLDPVTTSRLAVALQRSWESGKAWGGGEDGQGVDFTLLAQGALDDIAGQEYVPPPSVPNR